MPQELITSKKKIDNTQENTNYMLFRRCPWCNGYSRRKRDTATRVQILDETDCISHSSNTIRKGVNPIILLPAMGK